MNIDITILDALRRHRGAQLEPIASEADIIFSEEILGFRLPDALRSFYRKVCNGGRIPKVDWSPENISGAHIYGVRGGYNYDEKVIHNYYRSCMIYDTDQLYLYRGAFRRGWPERLIPIGFWGWAAGEFSICLDCNVPELPLFFFEAAAVSDDPNHPVPLTYCYDSFATFLHTILTVKNAFEPIDELVKNDNDVVQDIVQQNGLEALARTYPVSDESRDTPSYISEGLGDPFRE